MEDKKIRCPYCKEWIIEGAIKCRFCGSILNEAPQTGPTSIQNPETLIRQALGDKYEIQEVIGKGGMATVYKAVQKNLNRTVALKVIHQNLVHDTEFVSRFIREAQVSASLSHPNIVTVYDVGSIGSVHYMAMEFLEGEDLHQMVKQKGALNHDDVIKWIIPIAEALHYIHERGLIHRDIKSSNILITKEGRPVLTDFGIAHAADGTKLTQTGTVIGTPEYMSPEQAQGHTVDNRSDLYSLGVVMYECLTGKVPFKGDNPLTTIHKVIYEDPRAITAHNLNLPVWLNSVVLKLLAKDPKQRFINGNAFSRVLQKRESVAFATSKQLTGDQTQKIDSSFKATDNRFSNSSKTDSKSTTPPVPPKKNETKNQWIKWAMGLVAIFIIILVAININQNQQEKKQLRTAAEQRQQLLAEQQKEKAEEQRKTETARPHQAILQKYGMVLVEGGTFKMGSTESSDEKPIHIVTLSSFYISKYECTQQLWQEIMDSNPSKFKGSNNPVESVSWNEVQTFIKKLNNKTGMNFRLPTEAEWEFAAQGGNSSRGYKYSGSNTLENIGWYWKNSGTKSLNGNWDYDEIKRNYGKSHPVGKKQANELGLYDMSGNVWELCSDWYNKDYYGISPQRNPRGPSSGSSRIGRGGSWYMDAKACRVAARDSWSNPDGDGSDFALGFRLTYSLP